MERARQLVLKTRAPLVDIAVEVGFTDASYFAKTFKKIFGHSPGALRTRRVAASTDLR